MDIGIRISDEVEINFKKMPENFPTIARISPEFQVFKSFMGHCSALASYAFIGVREQLFPGGWLLARKSGALARISAGFCSN